MDYFHEYVEKVEDFVIETWHALMCNRTLDSRFGIGANGGDGEISHGVVANDLEIRRRLGRGSFSNVFLARDNHGQGYAFKVYNGELPRKYPEDSKHIVRNIREHLRLTRGMQSLVKPLLVSDPDLPTLNPQWCVMEFVEGINFWDIILQASSNGGLSISKKLRLVEGYAGVLKEAHERELVIVDNKWEAAILTYEGRAKMLDPDFVTREHSPILPIFTQEYACQEQIECIRTLHPTRLGDLESFAKMIDALFNEGYWLAGLDIEAVFSGATQPAYPNERTRQIPAELGEVVAAVLNRPREDLTIDDFISAIDQVA